METLKKNINHITKIVTSSFLLRGVIGNGFLKAFDMIMTIVLIIFFARYLGPDEYGIYVYAFTIASLIISPLSGIHTYIIRTSSHYHLNKKWSFIKGLFVSSNVFILLVLPIIYFIGIYFISDLFFDFQNQKLNTFYWALVLASLILFIGIPTSFLQGFNMVVKAQLPNIAIKVILFFLLIYFNKNLLASTSMILHVFAAVIVLFLTFIFLKYNVSNQTRDVQAEFSNLSWCKSSLPFFLVSGLFIINSQIDIVVIGLLITDADVGIYRVVIQNAFLVSLPLVIINTVIPPKINKLFESNKIEKLQKFIINSTRIATLFSLPIGIIFIIYGNKLLSNIYGYEYVSGGLALSILCIGQLINCMMGAVVTTLNMTGNEKEVIIGLIITCIINILLNFILVPKYGIEGAAAGTCLSMSFWNILLAIRIYYKIGINSTIFYLKVNS